MDEVGSDTKQKGDGAIRGEKLVCAKVITPREKCSSSQKDRTIFGLAAMDGTPVMCIVIFQGKQ